MNVLFPVLLTKYCKLVMTEYIELEQNNIYKIDVNFELVDDLAVIDHNKAITIIFAK